MAYTSSAKYLFTKLQQRPYAGPCNYKKLNRTFSYEMV